jgi:hypothetical protein
MGERPPINRKIPASDLGHLKAFYPNQTAKKQVEGNVSLNFKFFWIYIYLPMNEEQL